MIGAGIVCLIAAAANAEAAPKLTVGVDPIVLGQTESVPITIHVDERDEQRALWPLRIAANVGSFGPLEAKGAGEYHTVYVPPSTRFPQVALIAVWREQGPESPISFLRLPLYGATKLKVQTRPGAQVVALLQEKRFGPEVADGRGRAAIPLLVPPGVRAAQVEVTNSEGAVTTSEQTIDVPHYNRLTAAAVPTSLRADGEQWSRVEVMYDLGGADVSPERIVITPSEGTVQLRSAQAGRYTYVYHPVPSTAAERVTLSIRVEGDPAAAATVELSLRLPAPARAVLRPPKETLVADGRSTATVGVIVFDAEGRGLPQQNVVIDANGVTLPPPVYRQWGLYETTFTSPARFPASGLVQLTATVTAPAGSAPIGDAATYVLAPSPAPARVRARTRPSLPLAAPDFEAELVLEVEDASGAPLDDAQLLLTPSSGHVGPVRAHGRGRYVARFEPPPEMTSEPVRVQVTDAEGSFTTEVTVPLRSDPGSLLLGARAGLVTDLGALITPRIGLDLWVPLVVAGHVLALGARVEAGWLSREIQGLGAAADLVLVPISVLVSYELVYWQGLAVLGGIEGTLAVAQFRGPDGSGELAAGGGAGGTLTLSYELGPGNVFTEVGYAFVPITGRGFSVDAGGLRWSAGYRFVLF